MMLALAPRILLLLFMVILSVTPKTSLSARKAIVIGNDNYCCISNLSKARNDAVSIAAELQRSGFRVHRYMDLNYREMIKAFNKFYSEIEGGDEVVVFFSGHGVQTRTGSYLLPVDIEHGPESQVERLAYSLNEITDEMRRLRARFSLFIFDACRENPYSNLQRSFRQSNRLSFSEPAQGQMIIYSASRGQSALDRLSSRDDNQNSVFTRSLLTHMRKPGLSIEEIAKSVQEDVERDARSVGHSQRPAVYSEIRGTFFFFPPQASASTTSRMQEITTETAVSNTGNIPRSLPSTESIHVTITNFRKSPVRIEWIAFDGLPKLYNILQPYEAYVQQTYSDHTWIFREGSDILGFVTVKRGTTNINIR